MSSYVSQEAVDRMKRVRHFPGKKFNRRPVTPTNVREKPFDDSVEGLSCVLAWTYVGGSRFNRRARLPPPRRPEVTQVVVGPSLMKLQLRPVAPWWLRWIEPLDGGDPAGPEPTVHRGARRGTPPASLLMMFTILAMFMVP
jgi:hypothetical protein